MIDKINEVNGAYSLQIAPATARLKQITAHDIPRPSRPSRAPTAPERTISGGHPIHPKVVRGLIAQQQAADECLTAIHELSAVLKAL